MNETLGLILRMKELEKELEYNSDPYIRHYIQTTNSLILSMQAYIDYLLMDEDSVDGDDIKP